MKCLKKVLITCLCLLCLSITCVYARTRVTKRTTEVQYGYVHTSSAGPVKGEYEHKTTYELTGSLVTGEVWVEDGWGNVEAKSVSRGAAENTRYSYARARLISGSAKHYHYYQYWKMSL